MLMVSEVSGPVYAESGMGAVDKAAHFIVGRKQGGWGVWSMMCPSKAIHQQILFQAGFS